MGNKVHTVTPGETLATIANAYNVSSDSVVRANPKLTCGTAKMRDEKCIDSSGNERTKNGDFIYPGDSVYIPASTTSSPRRINAQPIQIDRNLFQDAGILGNLTDSDLNQPLENTDLSGELKSGIGALISAKGAEFGSSGLVTGTTPSGRRNLAQDAGVLGAMKDSDLHQIQESELKSDIDALIKAKGDEFGSD